MYKLINSNDVTFLVIFKHIQRRNVAKPWTWENIFVSTCQTQNEPAWCVAHAPGQIRPRGSESFVTAP